MVLAVRITAAREFYFWRNMPGGGRAFWTFPARPRCRAGDLLQFWADRDGRPEVVAEAVVERVEGPVPSWRVYWNPHTFIDRRRPVVGAVVAYLHEAECAIGAQRNPSGPD